MKLPPSILARAKPAAAAPKRVNIPRGMNGLERAYEAYLLSISRAVGIASLTSQPDALALADRCTYRPDFRVMLNSGAIRYDEVKGFERDDAVVKFKVAAAMYPQYGFRMVKRVRGEWVVTREYVNGKAVKLAKGVRRGA